MHPAALEVADQGRKAAAVRLVGDEQAAVLHGRGDLGRFSARGRGEIEDALSRLGIEDGNSEGRRLGLYVTAAEEVLESGTEAGLHAVEGEDVRRPGHSPAGGGAGLPQPRRLRHQWIDADRRGSG